MTTRSACLYATVSFVVTLASGTPAEAAFPDPPAPYTHVAVGDGGWQKTTTWPGGEIPGDGAIVLIPAGRDVAVTRQEVARHTFIRVEGILRMVIGKDTRLTVETLYVAPSGSLRIGTPVHRVESARSAEIMFTSSGPIDLAWDPDQKSRGLISHGEVRLHGAVKTGFVTMTRDALAGDASITVDIDLEVTTAGWRPGDDIVLTGTYFRKNQPTREERRTIQSIAGHEIVLDRPLAFDHVRASDAFALHVANLTRNVTLRSESPSLPDRGHAMFLNADVDLRHVAFVDLGRTDKTIPLDDTVVNAVTGEVSQPDPADVHNRRGRYAVHFHRNGIEPGAASPPSLVHDSVVVGTPGWGYVNHSSHVDFQRNVCYDFAGAAFVTEAGDELGNFIDNLAIRGTGNGEYRQSRIVFDNPDRPQPLSDFGFLGDAFWFQGPAIRVRGNVANGCHGAGMVWFTTGAPDITTIGPRDNRNNYVGFPETAVPATYGHFPDFGDLEGRRWDHAEDQIVISDLPILECDGFEAYGNFIGFRLRFNNFDNNAWYGEDPFDYDQDIVPIPGTSDPRVAVRLRERISNLVLWNNEQAFRSRYNSQTDFEGVVAVNRLRYSDNGKNPGGELNFQVRDTTMRRVAIDGYTIANWTDNGGTTSDVTYLTPPDFSNYAMYDTCKPCIQNGLCANVGPVSATATGSASIRLEWERTQDPGQQAQERYLIRYWVDGQDNVELSTLKASPSTTPTLDLEGLEAATTYRHAVLAGCRDLPSKLWSATATATTLP